MSVETKTEKAPLTKEDKRNRVILAILSSVIVLLILGGFIFGSPYSIKKNNFSSFEAMVEANYDRPTVVYCTTEYLVTDKNVMRKDGLFRTHTNQMPLNKIKNMDVKYTFWGKVFNYATITFSAGSNNVDIVFNCVKNAEKIKKMVNTLM